MNECVGDGPGGYWVRKTFEDCYFGDYLDNRKRFYKSFMEQLAKDIKTGKNKYISKKSIDWEFFVNNFSKIECVCDMTFGSGMIVSLEFSKNASNLQRLENFRKDGIFMETFGTDYPEMVEEYDGDLHLQFVWGTPEVQPYWRNWDAKLEQEKVINNLTLKENFLTLIKPNLIKNKVEDAKPRTYTNCEALKGKSYLELMDCENLFAKKRETEAELSQ